MDLLLTLFGFGLIGLTLTDFFYTTLSCNGSGGMTTLINAGVRQVFHIHTDRGRRWNGAVHLIATLLNWVILLLVAGFLVYAGFDDMVIHSSTQEPATLPQRAYMTGFVFSTLGTGDYIPGSDFSRYFTVVYSILGFGVLTTAITYIINVMSAANRKKNLATYISSMGNTPLELYDYFTTQPDGSFFTERVDDLVELFNTHINNQRCYPIVRFFLSDGLAYSATVQVASLHEATMALRICYRDDAAVTAHLVRMDRVAGHFLELVNTHARHRGEDEELLKLRGGWADRVPELAHPAGGEVEESNVRLGALLSQAGRSWEEVYKDET
ncbi:potassium channel family protein [Neolewinella sp.]|uniref:potassium channel family protein n=1 Tax=Neolewinella sp. TaxID=2993543 RepID=UPI003B51ED3F